jgi:AcrR family transcriptional regulator
MKTAKRKPPRRDAALSRRAILDAALVEFADLGHAGARIDAIAERAGVSKPMIYSYFGDKDGLWAAALREAYVQIRAGERELDLGGKEPEAAIRALVAFTQDHFVEKPWFISMLNTENLARHRRCRGDPVAADRGAGPRPAAGRGDRRVPRGRRSGRPLHHHRVALLFSGGEHAHPAGGLRKAHRRGLAGAA